ARPAQRPMIRAVDLRVHRLQLTLDHRLVRFLVPAGVAWPPPPAQDRDADQEQDDPVEADPVPGSPLAWRLRRGRLDRGGVRGHVVLDRRRDRGELSEYLRVRLHQSYRRRRYRRQRLELWRERYELLQLRRDLDHAGDRRLVLANRGEYRKALGAA